MGVDECRSALCKQLFRQLCVDAHTMEISHPRPCPGRSRFRVTFTPSFVGDWRRRSMRKASKSHLLDTHTSFIIIGKKGKLPVSGLGAKCPEQHL